MNPERFRRLLFLAVLTTLLVALPTFAGKRRAVKVPASPSVATISGTVLDAVTGQPVISARVEAGSEHDTTDATGKFVLKNVHFADSIAVKADRSGYTAQTLTVTAGGSMTLTFRLTPTATVRLRKVDNTTFDLDFDSVQFGFLSGFAGYNAAEFEDFCRPDGSLVAVNRTEISKVIGPAVLVDFTPCCKTSKIYKVNVELKNGTKTDVYFDDSCSGYSVDVIGRNHTTGKFEYVPFSQIAELVFP